MGGLTLPDSGTVYMDTNSIIYSIERIEPYRSLLLPVWEAGQAGNFAIVTSDLTLHEVLVKPLKDGNALLEAGFRNLLLHSAEVQLLPISHAVLERAASLRATLNTKTPDAIHAATALLAGCRLFLTNAGGFRRVPGLSVTMLKDAHPPAGSP